MHTYSAFARGLAPLAPPDNFLQVLENMWWPLDRSLALKDVELSAELMFLEGIKAGVTTVMDHHESQGCQAGSLDAIERAARRVGVRAALCLGISDRDGKGAEGFRENGDFIQKITAQPDRQIAALWGLHAPFSVEQNTLEAVCAAAAKTARGIHVHVSEGRHDEDFNRKQYGTTPLRRLHDAGGLNDRTLVVHGVHIPRRDWELLARSGAALLHNPRSNMNNAVGAADLPALLAAGVTLGLGTDGMSADVREDVCTAVWLQHHERRNPSAFFGEAVTMLLQSNPAIASRHFGLALGRLKKGCPGDVILIDYAPPTPLTAENFAGHYLFGIASARVHTSIINGEIVLSDGQSTRLSEDDLTAETLKASTHFQRKFRKQR